MKRINSIIIDYSFNFALVNILLFLTSESILDKKSSIILRYILTYLISLILMAVSIDRTINVLSENQSNGIENSINQNKFEFKTVIQVLVYLILFVASTNLHFFSFLLLIDFLNI